PKAPDTARAPQPAPVGVWHPVGSQTPVLLPLQYPGLLCEFQVSGSEGARHRPRTAAGVSRCLAPCREPDTGVATTAISWLAVRIPGVRLRRRLTSPAHSSRRQ